MPSGFVRAIVDRVIPSIVHLPEPGRADEGAGPGTGPALVPTAAVLGREHVRHTVQMLQSYSAGLSTAIAEGRCAIVGLEYALAEGRVRLVEASGALGVELGE